MADHIKSQKMMREIFTPVELIDIGLHRLYGLYNIVMALPETDKSTEALGQILELGDLLVSLKKDSES